MVDEINFVYHFFSNNRYYEMRHLTWFLTLFFLPFSWQSFSQGFLKTEGIEIQNSKGENVLLKGIGLGGHMLQEGYMLRVPYSGQQYVIKEHIEELIGSEKTKSFYNAWLTNYTQKADIDSLKSWGFNSVRLPMHYNLFTPSVEDEPVRGENTWIEKGFKLTDSILSWCKANKIYLILDMHATPGGQGHDVNISDRNPAKPSLWESPENQKKLIALWKKIAKRYSEETWIGAYDIINEPNWSFEEKKNKNGIEDEKNKPLKKLMVEITKAIREVDNNHIIIIEGNGWGNNYNGIMPPWDNNMVLSFHKYWNFNNKAAIKQILDFREKYEIPIWLGESGENSNTWFTDAISLMEENNIGWCWWPLKKMGFNNPLEIKVNKGYQEILEYWNGNAKKPSEKAAYKAFMQLAENTKIENNIFHKDVVDAMIRQPHSKEVIPFKETMVDKKAQIKAADYDLGKNGVAYSDNKVANYHISTGEDRSSWNNGYTYRNDGVDIFRKEKSKKYKDVYVGNFEEGEWLRYSFTVKKPAIYQIRFKISSSVKSQALVLLNDKEIGSITNSNNSEEWSWVNLDNIKISRKSNYLKIKSLEGNFKLESIEINLNE